MGRGGRRPDEPIYLRRHVMALAGAVALPVVAVQLYQILFGPPSFGTLLLIVISISILSGLVLHILFRSSAQNEP
ncbi:MAG: hypothetical protein NNA18_08050 [Nitrospira sp.]|nr:hypothetical protein [Nitrospira sp.]